MPCMHVVPDGCQVDILGWQRARLNISHASDPSLLAWAQCYTNHGHVFSGALLACAYIAQSMGKPNFDSLQKT